MRIAVVVNFERVLTTRKFTSRRSTLIGEKTIFSYDLEEIEDPAGFARLKSFVGTIVARGLKAILVCQPQIDGDQRLYKARASVDSWLDQLAKNGFHCRHRDYDPRSDSAVDTVLGFIEDFPVKCSKSIEEMLDSTRFLSTTETAAILSEHWREIRARDVRRLDGLRHEKSGRRRLGYRECDIAEFIKANT